MITNEYKFSDSKIIVNPNNMPYGFINRQIIAVWPTAHLDEIAERSDKLFKYVSLSMYKYRTGKRPWNNDFYKGYVDFITDIDSTAEIDTPYILIDGDIDVLKALHDAKMNYTLYTPMTVTTVMDRLSDRNCFINSYEEYNDITIKHNNLAFRHIMSDIPVDLFIIHNSGIIESSTIGLADIALFNRNNINNPEGGLYKVTLYMDKIN